jgi:hypothetical protein
MMPAWYRLYEFAEIEADLGAWFELWAAQHRER